MHTGTITIADGQTDSTGYQLMGDTCVDFVIPALTAGTVKAQASQDGIVYYDLYLWGTTGWTQTITGSITGSLVLNVPNIGSEFVKLVSSAAQSGAKTIQVISK